MIGESLIEELPARPMAKDEYHRIFMLPDFIANPDVVLPVIREREKEEVWGLFFVDEGIGIAFGFSGGSWSRVWADDQNESETDNDLMQRGMKELALWFDSIMGWSDEFLLPEPFEWDETFWEEED